MKISMKDENKSIKICVTASVDDVNLEIDSRFGRCEYFALFTVENKKIVNTEIIKNSGAGQSSGAGTNAAEQIGKLGADTLITPNIGPKAGSVLERLNIKIIKKTGIIKTVVEEYIKNNL